MSLIVGAFGVANIMFVTVRERTSQIGLKKAIGAKRRTILTEFLLESAFLCIIGGLIGLALVWLMSLVLSAVLPFPIYIAPNIIILALSICIGLGIISGIIRHALELAGRDTYQKEGCIGCHTQMVRPFKWEVDRFDPTKSYGRTGYSKGGEFVYDHPFLWGSKRTGPDLAHESQMLRSDEWHKNHLIKSKNRWWCSQLNYASLSLVIRRLALELAGRDTYQKEGCIGCHTQMVRPFKWEVDRF
ncbi:cbb3-type cytochrome c oxidase subunit II [Mycobacterium tuberculosis]|uniref:cbb3-type cytochrome c oxidase subunit II n=1 Tax=Mycobacterium tuberculosis TaxID=1773 RepID=UPI00272999E7|nr:cbb3-type cytochrome c oxidase subunit II [Mycobacterium tuberculosis]